MSLRFRNLWNLSTITKLPYSISILIFSPVSGISQLDNRSKRDFLKDYLWLNLII